MRRRWLSAVSRGVFVHALIAYTNRGGEKNLRKLEMRLLAARCYGGAHGGRPGSLSRQDDDHRPARALRTGLQLHHLDFDHSRSFGYRYPEPKAGAGGREAVRGRHETPALLSRATELCSESGERAQTAFRFPERRQKATPHLRSGDQRPGHDSHSGGTGQGRCGGQRSSAE